MMDQGMAQGAEGEGEDQDGMAMIKEVDSSLATLEQAISSAPNVGPKLAERMAKVRQEFQAIITEGMGAAQGGGGQGAQPVMDQSQGQPMGMQGGMR